MENLHGLENHLTSFLDPFNVKQLYKTHFVQLLWGDHPLWKPIGENTFAFLMSQNCQKVNMTIKCAQLVQKVCFKLCF